MWDNRPSDWEVRRLSDITTRITRKNDGEGHPVMTISAKRGFMLQSDKYSRDMAGQSAERYILLRRGEFAYNKGNSQTSPQGCVFKLGYASAVIPFVYYCFSLSKEIDPGYAAHAFQNGVLNRELARAINSGVRNDGLLNLPARDFFRCKIAVPPMPEQRAIAEVMDVVESAIGKSTSLIEALSEAKRAAMREVLTRGFGQELKPMKPIATRWVLGRIAEGVTHIPDGWELATLTKVAQLESGHTPSRDRAEYWDGQIPWLSLADTEALDALEVNQTSECITDEGIANSSARVLPKDTVVFSRTATVGKASRMKQPMATSQDFANWVCGPTLLPAYLVQVFRHMGREWDRLQEGSTHQTIYMPVFKRLQILLPPISEQRKIADIGEAFDLRITAERKTRKRLIQNRDALAQELLSGRLRLPDSIVARHCVRAGQAA